MGKMGKRGLWLLACSVIFTATSITESSEHAKFWENWRLIAGGEIRFPIWAWGYFGYRDYGDSEEDFKQYADGGFTLVQVKPSPQYLSWAKAAGLHAIIGTWQNYHIALPGLVRALELTKYDDDIVRAFILEDEPARNEFRAIGKAHDRIYNLGDDEAIPILTVLPSHAARSDAPHRFDPGEACGTSRSYCVFLDELIANAKPAAIIATQYPLWEGDRERPTYYENLEFIRDRTAAAGIGFMGFVLVTSHKDGWSGNRFRRPDESELRWQIYTLLAYGAKGLAYYNYRPKPEDTLKPKLAMGDGLLTIRDGWPTPAFRSVQRFNCDISAIGRRLMTLDSVDVYHAGSNLPKSTVGFAAEHVEAIEELSGGAFVLGVFERTTRDGRETYLMLVNKQYASDSPEGVFRIRLKKPYKRLRRYVSTRFCEERSITLRPENRVFILRLRPGEGALLQVL